MPSQCSSGIFFDKLDFERSLKRQRLQSHVTVFSQAYTEDAFFLAAGGTFGKVCIWDMRKVLGQDVTDTSHDPVLSFQVSAPCNGAHIGDNVYGMTTFGEALIVACGPNISAWDWKQLRLGKVPEIPIWSTLIEAECNSIAIDSLSSTNSASVYAACGSGNVHVLDAGTGVVVMTLKGHTDMVRLWDARQPASSSCVKVLRPREANVVSKCLGSAVLKGPSWVGAVAANRTGDWLACGGGGSLPSTLWHLTGGKSDLCVTALHPSKDSASKATASQTTGVTDISFLAEGGIRTLGHGKTILVWNLNGTVRSTATVAESNTLYTSAQSTEQPCPLKVTTYGGSSATLDIFTSACVRQSVSLNFTCHP